MASRHPARATKHNLQALLPSFDFRGTRPAPTCQRAILEHTTKSSVLQTSQQVYSECKNLFLEQALFDFNACSHCEFQGLGQPVRWKNDAGRTVRKDMVQRMLRVQIHDRQARGLWLHRRSCLECPHVQEVRLLARHCPGLELLDWRKYLGVMEHLTSCLKGNGMNCVVVLLQSQGQNDRIVRAIKSRVIWVDS